MNEVPPHPIRVLIADDHRLFREGLRALLSVAGDIDVVGEAGDGQQAVELSARLAPDVIVMDIQMPRLSGLEATRQILRASLPPGILIVSMFDDDDNVFSAMQAGARGYLLKGAAPEDLLRAVAAVARGEALFGPGIAQRLMRYFARPLRSGPLPFPELTDREREILALIGQGQRNPVIARSLELSEKTVRNHITSVFSKLQVGSRAEAALRAQEAGL
ncbi:response regulator [Deinococcus hopiensis]|uniref:Two component transcriptional regulator, LuxR family n=1 Tax=Deinococcus hopiensis KR-140 TaxID=695939 RepID=A0A1W1UE53_9DEIO|nr:response regulator transcription factor [Deinococcus hopiensis]SMB79329.1 two component transcriptional regulator, LuxR family [Deinococcus hopiensis KR-140]